MDWILGRMACGTFDEAQMLTLDGLFGGVMNLSERLSETVLPCLHAPIPDEVFLKWPVWDTQLKNLFALLLTSRRGVFVHCRLGVSRSPALCAAYLAVAGVARDLAEALEIVQARRQVTKIHPETLRGVVAWWEQR